MADKDGFLAMTDTDFEPVEFMVDVQEILLGRISQGGLLGVIEELKKNEVTKNLVLADKFTLDYYQDIVRQGADLTDDELSTILTLYSINFTNLGNA